MREHSRTDTLHRTRARSRLYLGSGFVLFAGALLAIWLLRPAVVPYTPGAQAAGDDEITSRLARGVPAAAPHVAFTDAAAETGIRFTHFHGSRSTQLPEDMGSGAAWGDYDGDGDPDLYIVNISGPLTDSEEAIASSPARSALFRNDGGHFTDVTDASGTGVRGTGMAAAWGDYDGDGDLDLFITRYGTNVLLRNDGNGRFTDVTADAGLGGREGFWTGASWGDYDRDGDVDLYVCGYVRYAYDEADAAKSSSQYNAVVPYTLNPSTYPPVRNLLYRNDGGHFTEVAREAGVENAEGRSLSAAWADLDGDGWPDLYVANDISDNVMYRNLGNGRFEDVSHSAWVADYRGAMGLAVGDRDNDGDLDIFVSHWIAQENALYDNLLDRMPASKDAPMHFIDDADLLGLGQIALDYIGWGTGFFDYDNDGRLDLFVANGSTFQREKDPSRLVPMKNLLFWNAGAQEGFYEVGSVSGPAFAKANVGRGAAIADFDLDGDLDVAVVDHGGAARLLRNGGSDGHWARILLRGPDGAAGAGTPSTSTFALGARLRIEAGGLTQLREVGSDASYLSQSPPGEVHFGLGTADRIDSLDVDWPDGTTRSFTDLPVDATIRIVEGKDPEVEGASPAPPVARGAGPGAPAGREALLTFWARFRQATRLRRAGDFGAAAEQYQSALSINPRHEDSLYYLGHCLTEEHRYGEARDAFVRLLDVNPQSARGHAALGELLASRDPGAPLDLDRAEKEFREAHKINGDETGPMIHLAEVLIVKGDLQEAGQWIEAAARTNHSSREAAFLAAYVRWEAGERAPAREMYARALAATGTKMLQGGGTGEGDRKPGAAGSAEARTGPTAAPSTGLFGDLVPEGESPGGAPGDAALAEIFGRVRRRALDLAGRRP